MQQATVFILNKGIHNYDAAEKFGKLHYLSKRAMGRYNTSNIFRKFYPILKRSGKDDYILLTSLNTMNVIACIIFALRHRKLNLLIHSPKNNTYVERKLDLEDI